MTVKLASLKDDPYLDPYFGTLDSRKMAVEHLEQRLTAGSMSLKDFASAHEYYGLHFRDNSWIFREWAPNADAIFLIGDFNDWQELDAFKLKRINDKGDWELILSSDVLKHQQLFKLKMYWSGGNGERIPAYIRRVVQDDETKVFNAQVWKPEKQFLWNHTRPVNGVPDAMFIYESHVGMAQENQSVGSFNEFTDNILPRIAESSYNTVQLMAVMEHPYYGSFGYHVSNFFAVSSRFGTPEDLKKLVDTAHGMGLTVIMDIVHSHAVKNQIEGLSCFDGTLYQYFHNGNKGEHHAWDSRCFDYGKVEVLHFLLSNCKFWMDEFNIDGFRFDGVTSMLYYDHGLGKGFDSYDDYFNPDRVDEQAVAYLALANKLIHSIRPDFVCIAEDVSGMPGLGASVNEGGLGFDYKLAMGIPDFWFKLLKEKCDEDWSVDEIFRELTNRRRDEKSISYVECHDQSIVGGKTLIFELIDADMYFAMERDKQNIRVERGVALHKMIRLLTLSTSGNGYLNFIGNEFGHPEWVDFPREGNNWSYKYARRQWSLLDNNNLRYEGLHLFDKIMIATATKYKICDFEPQMCYSHVLDHILVFARGDLLFIFNLNPVTSFENYCIDVPQDGHYDLLFDSDHDDFCGYNRLEQNQSFSSFYSDDRRLISMYLPSRTAIVLRYKHY
jgi:1,4-alpha-glucan branching enzyme